MELENSIKQYLENKMPEGERLAFEQKMAMDEQLKEEVAFQKEMYSFFDQREEVNALKKVLQESENDFFNEDIPKTKKNKTNRLIWIFPIGILLLAMYYFISTNNHQRLDNEETSSEEYLETKDNEEDSLDTKIELPNDGTEEVDIEEEKEELPPDLQNQPIADAGSYNPNPALEALLTTSFRADQVVEISSPGKGQTFKLKRRKILFSLNGTTNKENKLQLVMYDNNPRSFDEDYKALALVLSPSKVSDEEYSFSTKANIPLKKGLYYFVITNPETDDLLYVSKFEVK